MRFEDFSFEQRPLSDLPTLDYEEVLSWLVDFNANDQWVSGNEYVIEAALVRGEDITVWQDEPLTDSDMLEIVEEQLERRGMGQLVADSTHNWMKEGF